MTIVGNLTADPELKFTPNGFAVVELTIAATPRVPDRNTNEWKDGETLFLRASAWRDFAQNIATSLTKGTRVIATGKLRQRNFETKEGERRSIIELDLDEIGPSLKYAKAQVTRVTSGGDFRASKPVAAAEDAWAPSAPAAPVADASGGASGDQWNNPGVYSGEEPPF